MDLTAIVSAARRLPAVELRAPGERVAISLRLLATVVESVGALPELARELRARAPAETAALIVPAGSGQARIDLGQRQIAIPAALRDALLSALEHAAAPPTPKPALAAGALPAATDPAATARLIDASAATAARVLTLAGEPKRVPARAATAPAALAHATFSEPLLEPQSGAMPAAQRLHGAVVRSGLFFESHLAAHVHGEHAVPLPALRDELQAPLAGAARTAAQLDVLARDAVLLQGPVWPGQPATIELARDRGADADAHSGTDAADAPDAFSARLQLELPHLGRMQVELRLVGATVAVAVRSAQRAALARELPQLAAQFELRGLRPAALHAVELE